MRDMARVVTIKSYDKMFEKDRIVCAQFEETAYEAIIPKEDAIVGNLMAFIEADSILPEDEHNWEFLRKRCYREDLKGFLIKPMTMGAKDNNGEKGERVKSWGLAVSIKDLPITEGEKRRLKSGVGLTDALRIKKYEPIEDVKTSSSIKYPVFISWCLKHKITRWIGKLWIKAHKSVIQSFPSNLISKSDETTIQNQPSVLTKYADSKVIVTAKMEGQSFTVVPIFKEKKLVSAYVCSRNNAYMTKNDSIFWKMMDKYHIIDIMKSLYKETGNAYIIQGEQVGPNIQDNIYDFENNYWYLYTAKDYFTGKQVEYTTLSAIANILSIRTVPMITIGKMSDLFPNVDAAVKFAEKVSWIPMKDTDYIDTFMSNADQSTLWNGYLQHEGIVVRTDNYDKDNNIGCSFKVKNLQYSEKPLKSIHDICKNLKKGLK